MYNHLIKTDERNVVTAYVCVPYSVGGFTCIGQSENVGEMTVSEIRDGQALLLYKTMPTSETEKTPVAVFDREGTQWGVYERDREEIEADYRPPEPTDTELLLETAADHEYRLCLMELGVSEDDL